MSSMPDPLFILAPPCTFSWSICAMLGEHPRMYAFPELHLFGCETMAAWISQCSQEDGFEMDHGLLRAVAQIYFGEQTDLTIARARGWLKRRAHLSTGLLFEMIAGRLDGRVPVEKSPSIVYSFGSMKRAFEMFPTARFLHLVSHPELYEETVMRALQRLQPLPDAHWLMKLACHPRPDGTIPSQPDPQHAWQALHRDIMQFLERVPTGQQRRARGEALLAQDGEALREVLEWLGLPADAEALECMRHPEGSPYAHRGPDSAPSGSDIFLFEGPLIPTTWSEPRCLDGFDAEVRELARELGYAARALYALEADTAPG